MAQSSLTVEKTGSVAHLVGYYGALLGVGLVSASLGPTLSGLAAQTGVGLRDISVLFVARSTGYILGSLLSGRLYDRVRGHPVLAGAILTLAISMALAPLTAWLWLLAAVVVVIAMSDGAIDVGVNALLVWAYRDRVGPYMSGLHAAFGLGAFLAPIIVAQVTAPGSNLTLAYWALAALIVPPSLWILRLPSPAPAPRPVEKIAQAERRNYILLALLAAFFALYVAGEVSFGAWVFTYASKLGLADEKSAAYLTSAFWGALTAGRLLAIPVAARFRPRTILATDLIGCLISMGIALFWVNSASAIWIGAIGAGFFMASIFPTLLTFAERRMHITGQITSLFFIAGSLGAVFLPWLIGQLFERVGPRVTVTAIFVDVLVELAVFGALMLYAPKPVSPDKTAPFGTA